MINQKFALRGRISIPDRLIILAVAVFMWPDPIWAQVDQEPVAHHAARVKGFDPDGVFQFGQTDAVNLLNGNLSLSIPLGPTFQVGGGLQYSLVLQYNSNCWDFTKTCCKITGFSDPDLDFDAPWPSRSSNAGMGWSLSMGRLFEPNQVYFNENHEPWVYVDPSSARHSFYPRLHQNVPATVDPDVFYSNDGTYLRLIRGVDYRDLHFPDGTVHRFEDQGLAGHPDWRPVMISDPFGNWIRIDYATYAWTITDSIGRLQRVIFKELPLVDPAVVPEPLTHYRQIDRVEVSAFGQSNPNVGPAVYQFAYQPVTVERHRVRQLIGALNCNSDYSSGCSFFNFGYDHPTQMVELLTGVTMADPRLKFEMDYYTLDTDAQTGAKAGAIRSLALPSGALMVWRYGYGTFEYPTHPYDINAGSVDQADLYKLWNGAGKRNAGVVSKRIYADTGETDLLGEWLYERDQPMNIEAPNDSHPLAYVPCFKTVRVTDPEGTATVHYFSNATGQNGKDRYLPYTKCDPVNGGWIDGSTGTGEPSGPFLSRVVYDVAGTKLREQWVAYEIEPLGGYHERERRQVRSLTYFFDDLHANGNPHFVESRSSEFDGLGQYRLALQDSDFSEGRNQRGTFTNYNPGAVGIPAKTQPWVLGTFDRIDRFEGPRSNPAFQSSASYCFDPRTGFLLGKRLYGAGGGDILTRYTATSVANTALEDGFGLVFQEEVYGGDDGGLPAGNACAAPTMAPAFVMQHGYQFGVRARSDYLDCDGSVLLNLRDDEIDRHTGLVAISRDTAGVATAYNYDSMNRVVRVTAPGSASRHYDYPTQPLRTVARQCEEGVINCGNGNMLARQLYIYDSLGRVVTRRKTVPNPAGNGTLEAEKNIHYRNVMGWVHGEERWHLQGEPVHTTLFQDYDVFGRPGLITGPAGQEIIKAYSGDRVEQTFVQVQGAGLTEKQVYRDGYGRTFRVSEQAGSGGAWVHTTYAYDESDRLEKVCVDDDTNPTNACRGQSRTMAYDGRGLLVREDIPERDSAVAFRYDALGNPKVRLQGGSFDLSYTYDRAGRLTQLRDGLGQLLQEYFFARANRGADKSAGKLVMAKQHNRNPLSGSDELRNVIVTETFKYQDVAGRLSDYGMRADTGPNFRMAIQAYDPFNNVLSFDYPDCQGPPCLEVAPQRSQAMDYYAEGSLKSIAGILDNISYHATGMVKEIRHRNGVREQMDLDPQDNARIGEIRTTGLTVPSDNWTYGPYAYDHAENIAAIGPANFIYDGVSRLATAMLETGDSQDLSYDAFGNITRVVENGQVQEIPVSQTSNRLAQASFGYDIAGNLTRASLGGVSFQMTYDPLSRLTTMTGEGTTRAYAYTSDGERIAIFDQDGVETWTPRSPAGQILRRLSSNGLGWFWHKDYHFADSAQVAVVTPAGVEHLHRDHLGTTRQVTDAAGVQLERITLFPFGKSVVPQAVDAEELQFTGHERDRWDEGQPAADVDYMHARYYTPHLGKFFSVDPYQSGDVMFSQTWNKYAYSLNNPVRYIDPEGFTAQEHKEYQLTFEQSKAFWESGWSKLWTVGKWIFGGGAVQILGELAKKADSQAVRLLGRLASKGALPIAVGEASYTGMRGFIELKSAITGVDQDEIISDDLASFSVYFFRWREEDQIRRMEDVRDFGEYVKDQELKKRMREERRKAFIRKKLEAYLKTLREKKDGEDMQKE